MESYECPLGDGLILRSVRDERDAQRYIAFFARYHTPISVRTADILLHRHPHGSPADYLFVEDQRTGEMVSTTGLIPWRCSLDGVTLSVAQLEMVVTQRSYRHRGLIRAQVRRFHEMVSERGYDLSVIEGIPYYYRQYGYTYAVDHRAYDALPAWRIPEIPADLAERYVLRPAAEEDAPLLNRLYTEGMAGVQFAALRDETYWRFLLRHAHFPARLLEERPGGRVVGYVVAVPIREGRGIRVLEAAVPGREAGLAVLAALAAEAARSPGPRGEIQLGWPASAALVQLARSLGSAPLPAYQWLLRIPDAGRFLERIAPCLERRLAASDCAGLTADLCLNLYREAYLLHFRAGKLEAVERPGFVDYSMGAEGEDLPDHSTVGIPPEAFVRLATGYRTLEELSDAWPDIVVRPAMRRVVEVLFPRLSAYFCMPYLYLGPLDSSDRSAAEG